MEETWALCRALSYDVRFIISAWKRKGGVLAQTGEVFLGGEGRMENRQLKVNFQAK